MLLGRWAYAWIKLVEQGVDSHKPSKLTRRKGSATVLNWPPLYAGGADMGSLYAMGRRRSIVFWGSEAWGLGAVEPLCYALTPFALYTVTLR